MFKKLAAAVLIFISLSLYSQDLLPFTENYSKSDYQGDNQIWSVAQGIDKAMYFANNQYFLRYDGVKWEKYTLPNKMIIRSLHIVGDRIYSGSYKEFGYWHRSGGKMNYVSLSRGKNIFDVNSNEEVWKIFEFDNKIYFQCFNEIFTFDQKKIDKISLPFQISYCFAVGDELLFASTRLGIFKRIGDKFQKILNGAQFENKIVHGVADYKGKRFFFTQKDGVFISENGILKPWQHQLNGILKTAIINTAKFVGIDKLAVGTAGRGIFIVDLSDNSFQNINRNNVLMNNSILDMTVDGEGDLWLGLDNGIAHIEVSAPISVFYDQSGILGSVYSVAATNNGGYLIASNHGVFKYEDKVLRLIENSQGQAWDIHKFGPTFFIGHNEGTFIYKENIFSKVSNTNGGWNLVKSGVDNSWLQCTYCGIVIYRNPGDLSDRKEIKGLCKPIKYAAQNRKNELWAADNYRGLYRIVYDENYETKLVENISEKSGLKNDFGVKIFEFRNEVLFFINQHWYTYNALSGKLEISGLFEKYFRSIDDIAAIDNNNFIILQDGLLYLVAANDDKFVKKLIQEKYYSGKIINENLKIFKDGERYLLNLDDGFLAFKLSSGSTKLDKINIEAYYKNQPFPSNSSIEYNTGISINIVSGKFGFGAPNFFYAINQNKLLSPIKNGTIILTNLSSGNQEVNIFTNNGDGFIQVGQFTFTVDKPWYFSIGMILLYLGIIILILALYYRWNNMRYQQKLSLREEELKHQKNISELKLTAENDLKIQEYEKHILGLEIQSKSSEVAGKSLSIAKQSEIIESIQKILLTENDANRLKSEIKKAIKVNAINKHEWEAFETLMNQIHNDFTIKLLQLHPTLTAKDVKLSVYLRLNLASKEIAPLMNISFRGVELHRYRLRKKMGIAKEENLNKYMSHI